MKNFTQEISNMTSESEDRMLTNGYIDSPSIEEVSSGGNVAGGCPLKKGPWTTAEDAILVEYVSKHGEGNWNAVQKHSGLSRCGKSCRLRWANHLRPDLKKGAFTADEERRIVELHAKMGNKWARMAAELPGRTDNEIKNFWNTRIKRRQRAGLPIYPPDICMQALLNENNPSQDMAIFSTGDMPHSDLLPTNNLEIPSVEFKSLELNQQFYTSFLDIPAGSNSFLFSAIHPAKRLRESELVFNQYQDDDSQKIAKSFGASLYDRSLSSSSCLFSGSHAFLNGNSSSSEPISWAMKMELPSLQYADTQMDTGWGPPSSPLPSLESVDTLIQTPPTEQTQSDCLSPRNNGLLESVLYESQTHKNSKKNSCQKICDASSPVDGPDSLSKLNDAEWDIMYAEPNSPLGHSVGSVFSECTPISGSSSDEHNLVKTLPVKQEKLEWFSTISDEKDGLNFSRPDYLLDSNWFGPCSERGKNHSILTDAIGALLCEEFSSDSRQVGAAGRSHESCEWDMSTTICEISEHH